MLSKGISKTLENVSAVVMALKAGEETIWSIDNLEDRILPAI